MLKQLLLFLFLLFLAVSCTTTFKVDVDAQSTGIHADKTICLVPANEDFNEADPFYRKYKKMIKDMLIERGFVYTDQADESEQIAYLSYGIKSAESKVASLYNLQVQPNASGAGSAPSSAPSRSAGYSYYPKFISIYSYENIGKDSYQDQKPIWSILITRDDGSNNLLKEFPLMLEASKEYISQNFKSSVKLKLEK